MNNNMIWIKVPELRNSIFVSCKQLSENILISCKKLSKNTLIFLEASDNKDIITQYLYYNLIVYYAERAFLEDLAADQPNYNEKAILCLYPDEIEPIYEFCQYFDELTTGDRQTNQEYIHNPQWPKLQNWAGRIFQIMEANNIKYTFDKCYDKWNELFWLSDYQEFVKEQEAKQQAEQERLKSF